MKDPKDTSPTNLISCERCGAPVEPKEGFPNVCDKCYSIYGSCCNEWEDEES